MVDQQTDTVELNSVVIVNDWVLAVVVQCIEE
jgi:hypothetical protein